MPPVEARSKTITLIAAAAENGVIGNGGKIPWRIPEDFAHFKRSTLHQTLLMGRTTFDSIGHALPDRRTIVVTRNFSWSHPDVIVAHDIQDAIDLAEEHEGELMVAGGSHIYAATIDIAHLQILSTIHSAPAGDAYYPKWDPDQWYKADEEDRGNFSIATWNRKPVKMRDYLFEISSESAAQWWGVDWAIKLSEAVEKERQRSGVGAPINWTAVHTAAQKVIIEAAEDYGRTHEPESEEETREVRLTRHLSVQDIHAVQGALFHWSTYLAPRHQWT